MSAVLAIDGPFLQDVVAPASLGGGAAAGVPVAVASEGFVADVNGIEETVTGASF